jgi:hypothetical protein
MSRYWEDVQVDEEIPPVEKLPTSDMAVDFFGRNNRFNPAFRDAEQSKRLGLPGTLVPGVMKLAWMTQFAYDWAGPDSFLRSVRVAYRKPDIAGTPLILAGRVVDKREEDGAHVVELEVATVADGQPTVRGNVVIQLPTRGG